MREGLAAIYPAVFALTDKLFGLWECSLASTPSMTFWMDWSFKTGYHEIVAKKFLATGAPFPECKSWKRWHALGSVEGWILVEADNADACYEHAAEWAEALVLLEQIPVIIFRDPLEHLNVSIFQEE